MAWWGSATKSLGNILRNWVAETDSAVNYTGRFVQPKIPAIQGQAATNLRYVVAETGYIRGNCGSWFLQLNRWVYQAQAATILINKVAETELVSATK